MLIPLLFSIQYKNVRQRAWPIEEHAEGIYTAAAYGLLRKEIDKSTFYFAKELVPNKEFAVFHVKPEKRLPWGREMFKVLINSEDDTYNCECGLYKHSGFLCGHVLRVR